MVRRGRPMTPDSAADRPRFVDRLPETFKRPDANPYLTAHRTFGPPLLVASEAWKFRGRWAEAFGREAPLHVEIGSGNGFFLAGLSARHPDRNVLGIEIRYKRTVLCAKKILTAGVKNALIARYDAWYLDDLFEDGAIAGLYVNHPDPWPKTKQIKHRLMSRWFLEEACRILKPGGIFRLKSDFLPNIQRVVDTLDHDEEGNPLPHLPLQITGRSDDVVGKGTPWPDDIETNYQSKFRLLGKPVYAIELRRSDGA